MPRLTRMTPGSKLGQEGQDQALKLRQQGRNVEHALDQQMCAVAPGADTDSRSASSFATRPAIMALQSKNDDTALVGEPGRVGVLYPKQRQAPGICARPRNARAVNACSSAWITSKADPPQQHQRLAQRGDTADVFLARRCGSDSSSAGLNCSSPFLDHQRATAEWRVYLMSRKGEIVNPAPFDIDLAVGDQLCRIHQQTCPIAVNDATDRREIVAYAEDIRSAAHGHQLNSLFRRIGPSGCRRPRVSPARSDPQSLRRPPQAASRSHAGNTAPRQLVRVVFQERVQLRPIRSPCANSWRKLSATRLMASVVLDVKITS